MAKDPVCTLLHAVTPHFPNCSKHLHKHHILTVPPQTPLLWVSETCPRYHSPFLTKWMAPASIRAILPLEAAHTPECFCFLINPAFLLTSVYLSWLYSYRWEGKNLNSVKLGVTLRLTPGHSTPQQNLKQQLHSSQNAELSCRTSNPW